MRLKTVITPNYMLTWGSSMLDSLTGTQFFCSALLFYEKLPKVFQLMNQITTIILIILQ